MKNIISIIFLLCSLFAIGQCPDVQTTNTTSNMSGQIFRQTFEACEGFETGVTANFFCNSYPYMTNQEVMVSIINSDGISIGDSYVDLQVYDNLSLDEVSCNINLSEPLSYGYNYTFRIKYTGPPTVYYNSTWPEMPVYLYTRISQDQINAANSFYTEGTLYIDYYNELGEYVMTYNEPSPDLVFSLTPYDSEQPCLGDFDFDGYISVTDLLILVSSFGSNSTLTDLNDNGFVDSNDVIIFIGVYGSVCP